MNTKSPSEINRLEIYRQAAWDSVVKLDPRRMARNPVLFIVEIGSVLTTGIWLYQVLNGQAAQAAFAGVISIWLWLTVLFANFAEALAEGRGKAQAAALRRMRRSTQAKKLASNGAGKSHSQWTSIPSTDLRQGDLILVEAGDIIPADGEVIEGVASVDESAVTGESAPVIRESGGDRSAVTGGTRILSDWLVIQVTANPGEGFLDRMISLIEGTKRQKTPNEVALSILLAGFTIAFLVICVTLLPFSAFSIVLSGQGSPITLVVLISLLVCLIPTTISGLLSAIGIAGMDRLIRHNVIALSGRAIEAAGDVNVLMLDKTGTITLGNRQAVKFVPVAGVSEYDLAEAAQLASLADETPEGRSIVVLAKELFGIRAHQVGAGDEKTNGGGMSFIPFSARTRMSGVDIRHDGSLIQIRKGAPDTMLALIKNGNAHGKEHLQQAVGEIARSGGTPLLVAQDGAPLGVIHLKDVVKGGIRERFAQLRRMGIKTVMITGDNPVTAAAIAAEAGVDDFLAEATPEAKLTLIRKYQVGGQLVAMAGDGTNDAPALAQADVAVAMNTGTQPAREAANMVDLDSNPTKLIEIVEIGKQLLMTRGALTTFSLANDVAKYFAIIPAAFVTIYPSLAALNFMRLATPESAILSAVIFNALIIVALIPLALRGVPYRPVGADRLLLNNLLIYGVGGLIAPFAGIKLIDLILVALGLV
jgi:potassium-transporting ATPase ATP-binding subunit